MIKIPRARKNLGFIHSCHVISSDHFFPFLEKHYKICHKYLLSSSFNKETAGSLGLSPLPWGHLTMLFPSQIQSSKRQSGYELHGVLPNSHVKALNTQNLRSLKRLKPGLNLSIQKAKTMASGLITLWQIEWGKVETMTDFILGGGSKITADSS